MKRLFAAAGAAFLLVGATLPAASLTLPYSATGAYRNSTYHQNLTLLTETGDEAFDTVAAALSQLGYHEGNGTADLHGNGAGSGNYTEYGRAFGKIGGTYGYAWCAVFASWCLRVAGAEDAAGGGFSSCSLWIDRLKELGIYSTRASGYVPKQGDLIFFRSAGAGRASDHVGVVRYVKGGRVYTVEGNSSNRVSANDYALSDTYIVGYGKPKYGGAGLTESVLAMEDKTAGFYVVINDFLNVRADAAVSAKKLGALDLGDVVTVTEIQNGWGRISYKGQTAYISLDYADLVSPLQYTVQYQAEGERWQEACFSFAALTAATAPERHGYRFLHWVSADGRQFAAGDVLPGGDLVLTAVYETLPATPEETPPAEESPTPPQDPAQPDAAPPADPQPPADAEPDGVGAGDGAAAAHAGVISGLLSAVWGLWWYVRRFLW